MKKALATTAIGVATAFYVAFAIHAVSKQGTEALLVCADAGGLNIPFSKYLCREYLFTFRGLSRDIDVLHQGVGATFVIQGSSTSREREQVLTFLLGKGLDINQIDMHGLTPLHSAVLTNSADDITVLLTHGASADLKDRVYGLTALELALKLQRECGKNNDWARVISALKSR
jgi:ankyrin repeat protein